MKIIQTTLLLLFISSLSDDIRRLHISSNRRLTILSDAFASRVRASCVFDENIENYSFRPLGRFISLGFSKGMTYSGGGRCRSFYSIKN